MPNVFQALRSSISGRRPVNKQPGELYVNLSDLQLGVIDLSGAARDLVPVRYFSTTTSYGAGDVVFANGALRVCRASLPPGPFNPVQWQTISGDDVLVTIGDSRWLPRTQDTPPASPVIGQIWVDSSDLHQPKIWNGTAWDVFGAHSSSGATSLVSVFVLNLKVAPGGVAEPADPLNGDPFDLISSAVNYCIKRFVIVQLLLDVAPGTYTDTVGITLAPANFSAVSIRGNTKTNTVYTFTQAFSTYITSCAFSNIHIKSSFSGGGPFSLKAGALEHTKFEYTGATNPAVKKAQFIWAGQLASLNTEIVANGHAFEIGLLCSNGDYVELGNKTGAPTSIIVNTDAASAAIKFENIPFSFTAGLTISTPGTQKVLRIEKSTVIRGDLMTITLANGANWGFSGQLIASPNGHTTLPNAPVVLQWGTITHATAGPHTHTFPRAFPNACWGVQITLLEFVALTFGHVRNITNTGFDALVVNTAGNPLPAKFNWFAYGI